MRNAPLMIQPVPYIFPSFAALASNFSGVYSDKIWKVGNTFPQPNFSNGSPYYVQTIAKRQQFYSLFAFKKREKVDLATLKINIS